MASTRCCVPGCNNTQTSNCCTKLHRFPHPDKEPGRFFIWLHSIRGDLLSSDNKSIHDNRRVCRSHFEDKYHFGKKLTANAVPTLNIQDSAEWRRMFSSSRLISQIGLHFTSADEEKKVRCLYCDQKLSIANKSTCSLIRHMHKKHPKHIVRTAHLESKYNVNAQESKKKNGFFYKKSISIKKQKEIDGLLTGGEKHEFIPPDETLDKVADILGPNCDGYNIQFDSDDVVNVVVIEQEEEATQESTAVQEQPLTLLLPTENEQNQQILGPAELSPHTSKSKLYFTADSRKGKSQVKNRVLVNGLKRSVYEKNLAIAKYYDSKRKREEELHFLRKKKLQLEIMEKEKKILTPSD